VSLIIPVDPTLNNIGVAPRLDLKWLRGQADWRREMNDLVRYRALESLCRQSAVFHPDESWRLLAEAEMWHHKAEAVASRMTETPAMMVTSGVIGPSRLTERRGAPPAAA
jgi:hypothetical protein